MTNLPFLSLDNSSFALAAVESAMESIQRLSHLLYPISVASKHLKVPGRQIFSTNPTLRYDSKPLPSEQELHGKRISRRSRSSPASAGWFVGFGEKKPMLPDIVKVGDPVLHEPARDVAIDEIGSEKIQKIVDDMVAVMRKAPGVGLAAPQIGIPLRIVVLEDTKEYISYARKEDTDAQDRQPFDLLVILNPKLKKKSDRTALFFEGCLSVDGFRAMVERSLEVEVTGFNRDGQPIQIGASGWQARILQHECDHLDGTIYVDKMLPRTFRTVDNLDLPLPRGCPKLGAC
ncbi:peptide deformylase 1A, chloroplastic [Aristolochia californica]|uniref:peptide deformylase 1A, chloroplastic n=1 Tax=Aristolochia californica TaxID=171875 RepID=UPI0035DA53D5